GRLRTDAARAGLPADRLVLTRGSFDEMPALMRLMHVGVFFIRVCFSKRASAATRLAEFLGCGIPVVINDGIGDSGALVRDGRAHPQAFTLRLARCEECTLMQMLDVVPPAEIFSQYSYSSSTTHTLIEHFARMGADIVAAEHAAGRLVVEFGCNDGILLRP